jgi:WD40 repeat protein
MNHDGIVFSVAFSPDGKYVVSQSDDYIARVWETSSGKEIARMTDDYYVIPAVFSPSGKYVLSESNDNATRVWEASTGKEVARMTHDWKGFGISSITFSPDGQYVASAGCDKSSEFVCLQGTVLVWDASTDKEVARITHGHRVSSVAFSPDGKYLVFGSDDGTARVWEVAIGREIVRMRHDSFMPLVAFSSDGKYVVSVSATARVWMWRPEDLIFDACARLTRNLTRAEWDEHIGDALPYQAVCPNLPIEPEITITPTP